MPGFLNQSPRPPLGTSPSTPLGNQGTTSRGLYETALPWYCKTLLMSRGPQVLTVLGRWPQTMKGWEPLLYAVVGHGRVRNPVLVHAIYGIFYAIHATSGRTKSFFEVWTEVTTHLRWRFYGKTRSPPGRRQSVMHGWATSACSRIDRCRSSVTRSDVVHECRLSSHGLKTE